MKSAKHGLDLYRKKPGFVFFIENTITLKTSQNGKRSEILFFFILVHQLHCITMQMRVGK